MTRSLNDIYERRWMFRKIRSNNLDKINRLQSMKKLPIGGIGERDSRINKLINKLYNRKEQTWV